jgi:hypothetical protein
MCTPKSIAWRPPPPRARPNRLTSRHQVPIPAFLTLCHRVRCLRCRYFLSSEKVNAQYTPEFLAQRRQDLEVWIKRLHRIPCVACFPVYLSFLEADKNESLKTCEWSRLRLLLLCLAAAAAPIPPPTPKACLFAVAEDGATYAVSARTLAPADIAGPPEIMPVIKGVTLDEATQVLAKSHMENPLWKHIFPLLSDKDLFEALNGVMGACHAAARSMGGRGRRAHARAHVLRVSLPPVQLSCA